MLLGRYVLVAHKEQEMRDPGIVYFGDHRIGPWLPKMKATLLA